MYNVIEADKQIDHCERWEMSKMQNGNAKQTEFSISDWMSMDTFDRCPVIDTMTLFVFAV